MKTIDMTPTWTGLVEVLLELANSKNAEARKTAREEIYRMAKAADLYNEEAR